MEKVLAKVRAPAEGTTKLPTVRSRRRAELALARSGNELGVLGVKSGLPSLTARHAQVTRNRRWNLQLTAAKIDLAPRRQATRWAAT